MHVVREQEGIRGVRAHLLQQLLGHCKESTPSITTLLLPCSPCFPGEPHAPACLAWGGHSRHSTSGPCAPGSVGSSHHRCKRPAAASSCRGGMGPQRWPRQQPRCSSPCGGTSWRPCAERLEPHTLQRHEAWTHGQSCLPLPAGHQPAEAMRHRYSPVVNLCRTLCMVPVLFLSRTILAYLYGVLQCSRHHTLVCRAGIVHNLQNKWPGWILVDTAA